MIKILDSEVISNIKILIADDSQPQRLMLTQLIENAGYQVIVAEDGEQAIRLFTQKKPDLVILDIFMLNMDGIEAASIIKKQLGTKYIPIIFITVSENNDVLERCIEVGADDFITKPFNSVALIAKICSLLRVKFLYDDQYKQKKQLQKFQQQALQEEEVAATLFKNILHAGFLETSEVKYLLSPMALFNGDIFLVAKTPGNHLYALLGDFTGHGLGASIGATPAADIFYGMTEKGFGITEIIIELNRKMHKLLPVHMFLSATIVGLFPDAEIVNLITCGLPDHYLHRRKSNQLQLIKSDNLPLGISPELQAVAQVFSVTQDDFLYLFTDGVIEAENKEGKPFNDTGVIQTLKHAKRGYDEVLAALDKHTQNLDQQDDITFVELNCNVQNAKWMALEEKQAQVNRESLTWKSSMELQAAALRKVNPVPVLIHSVMEVQDLIEHRESIFLIVTELFANALEHGLLQLDSSMKDSPEGFMQFYAAREQRLSQLTDGVIKIHFSHRPTDTGGRLTIRVQDSGNGFDFKKTVQQLDKNQQKFGRGISLLHNLCKKVEYSGNGNRVKVIFEWDT